jgi:hypothetical protein
LRWVVRIAERAASSASRVSFTKDDRAGGVR